MSSSEEGDEGGHWPNCQTNLVLVHHELSLLFCHFINTTAYHHMPLAEALLVKPIVEGAEGSYLPNCQTNLAFLKQVVRR